MWESERNPIIESTPQDNTIKISNHSEMNLFEG
jgi:hypothetical protein